MGEVSDRTAQPRPSLHRDTPLPRLRQCAFVHHSHPFVFATSAAISSRSPTDHAEGPRIASCVTSLHRLAVEVGAVLDQLDDIEHRLAARPFE